MARDPSELTDHVVICNVNEKVRAIVEQLRHDPVAGAIDIALIVQDAKLWEANPEWHPPLGGAGRVFQILGCPAESDALRRARIAQARAAVILADPELGMLADARSALVGIAIERENPHVHTVMELILSVNRSHLRATAVDEVICLGELSEKLLSQSAVTPGVSKLFAHLLSSRSDTGQLFVRPVPNVLVGSTYRELARRAIRNDAPYVVCGFIRHRPRERGGRHESIVVFNPRVNTVPGKDSHLDTRDSLILLASGPPDLSLMDG